jgi:hypothetical protein
MNYGAWIGTNTAEMPTGSERGKLRAAMFARAGIALSVGFLLSTAGCHKSSAQDSAFSYAAQPGVGDPQDSGQPDYGNLAPVDGQYPTQNEAQQQASQYQQGGVPIERRYPGAQDPGAYPQSGDPNAYDGDQAAMDDAQAVYDADLSDEEATQAPPPLPDYDQPSPPDPDYIWTPGYWAWSPEGYYWVPGAWVEPPYVGALWTPGYWGFYGGRYRFHHGFWGLHIGFYGGINYGYGYTGYGYYGGYWRGGHFFYNREVNHIDPRVIVRVYDYRVREDRFAGRPSFNGPRGIMVRPRPAEIAVLHERRYAPLPAQMQLRQQSMENRQQFYRDNHGRPAMTVAARPVVSNHQMPAALPQPDFRGHGDRRNGYRQDANRGDRGGSQGAQPGQPQVQPNPQGRVMPQQGRQPNGGQVQGQPIQQQPQTQQDWRRGQDGGQGRQPYEGRGARQAQQQPAQTEPQPQAEPGAGRQDYRNGGRQQPVPAQAAPAPGQPQPQVPSGLGAWQQRHGQQQPGAPVQPQPQPQAQPQPQPQRQPQPQQDYRRGGWQGRGQPQAQPQPPVQPQPQPQPQQQFRRGPEGARMGSQPQPAPQQRPAPQPRVEQRQGPPPQAAPQQHGHEGRGRDEHER